MCSRGAGRSKATAERFQVDAKTVRKWRDRYLREGVDGLGDRSSRPRSSPRQTRRSCQRRVVSLRRRRRWGAARIAAEVGIATSTAQSILNAAGLGRLNRGDRASVAVEPRRYQRDRPGELVHVDVKKLSRIRPGAAGGRTAGGQMAEPARPGSATPTSTPPSMTAPGWPTRKSSTTNKDRPRPCSGRTPWPISPAEA